MLKKQEPAWQQGTEKNGKRKPPASYHFTTVEVAWAPGGEGGRCPCGPQTLGEVLEAGISDHG